MKIQINLDDTSNLHWYFLSLFLIVSLQGNVISSSHSFSTNEHWKGLQTIKANASLHVFKIQSILNIEALQVWYLKCITATCALSANIWKKGLSVKMTRTKIMKIKHLLCNEPVFWRQLACVRSCKIACQNRDFYVNKNVTHVTNLIRNRY